MVAKYEMNYKLALDHIAHDLNTFGAPQGTKLERICIINNSTHRNYCHSVLMYIWCRTAHLGR